MKRIVFACMIFSALAAPAAHAAPITFFDNLTGDWSGSGEAFVKKFGDISATCKVAVKAAPTTVAMKGSCGKLLFRQALGLSIKNVGANKYVGTYTGSGTGPAALEGTLRGNRLVMNITWGGLVNGDRKAQMVLERTGPDSFAQTVNDSVAGVNRSTSRFTFKRR